jgi:FHS family L-fucose permease-like MFS transporter
VTPPDLWDSHATTIVGAGSTSNAGFRCVSDIRTAKEPALPRLTSLKTSLAALAVAYFLWGVARSLDDVLVSAFHASGMLSYSAATLIHFSFFSGYLFISLPAGDLLTRFGYRNVLAGSVALMTAGTATCAVATLTHEFLPCAAGSFILALGIAALQTAGNPCVGLLGREASATARLLVVQSFGSFGSVIGPVSGTLLFRNMTGATSRLSFPALPLGTMYIVLTILSAALAAFVWLRWNDSLLPPLPVRRIKNWAILRLPRLQFGIVAVFLCIGAEATVINSVIPYFSRTGGHAILPSAASAMLSVYWVAVIVGRLVSARLLKTLDTRSLLQAANFLAALLVLGAIFLGGRWGGSSLLAVGLFNAAIFPCIFTLSVSELEPHDLPLASAFLSCAIFGGAVLPLLCSSLAEHIGFGAALSPVCAVYLAVSIGAGIAFPRGFRRGHHKTRPNT